MTTKLTNAQRAELFENRGRYLTELHRRRASTAEPVTEAVLTDAQREALFEHRGQALAVLTAAHEPTDATFAKDFAETLMTPPQRAAFQEALAKPKPHAQAAPRRKVGARTAEAARHVNRNAALSESRGIECNACRDGEDLVSEICPACGL